MEFPSLTPTPPNYGIFHFFMKASLNLECTFSLKIAEYVSFEMVVINVTFH